MSKLRIAVIGAGVIGKTHIERALRHADVELAAICDTAPAAEALARAAAVPWYRSVEELLDKANPRGAVIATPNATHAPIAVRCLDAGVAVVVEKPIADTLEQAQAICDAARRSGQAAIVGHQRRHNPVARRARELVVSGALGRPVCATALCTWYKPPEYFAAAWRREPGGGPVLINLIHDIDLLRFLFGELASVQALTSSAIRGYAVEDTVAVGLAFRNGALGTVTVSDTAVAPWNWDLAAGEAERFPRQDVNSHYLSGTEASLTLPRLELWRYQGRKGWEDPIAAERAALHAACPYAEQLRHFRAVIEGREAPVCSAEDARRTLEATLAVRTAATSGRPVPLEH